MRLFEYLNTALSLEETQTVTTETSMVSAENSNTTMKLTAKQDLLAQEKIVE